MRLKRRYSQKNRAQRSDRGFGASFLRLALLVALCFAMGTIAYLIAQKHNGLLSGSLAAAVTILVTEFKRR